MKNYQGWGMKWQCKTSLYKDRGNVLAVMKAFAMVIAICFALVMLVIAWSIKWETFVGIAKVWGYVAAGFMGAAVLGWFVWAWANGGVSEWSYEMDEEGITGVRIVHKAWRMKLLRGLGWFLMLLPAKPGQKMAMRGLLYGDSRNKISVAFAAMTKVGPRRDENKIVVASGSDATTIFAGSDDFDRVLAFIERRMGKSGASRTTRSTKKRREHGNEKD